MTHAVRGSVSHSSFALEKRMTRLAILTPWQCTNFRAEGEVEKNSRKMGFGHPRKIKRKSSRVLAATQELANLRQVFLPECFLGGLFFLHVGLGPKEALCQGVGIARLDTCMTRGAPNMFFAKGFP